MEISAPRASRDHAKSDASGAAHLSEWSLCTYVERALRIVDSTRLYRAALDFSSMHCVPRNLEGGFGKSFQLVDKTVRIRNLSLRDVPSGHPVRHLSERRLRQQIAKRLSVVVFRESSSASVLFRFDGPVEHSLL